MAGLCCRSQDQLHCCSCQELQVSCSRLSEVWQTVRSALRCSALGRTLQYLLRPLVLGSPSALKEFFLYMLFLVVTADSAQGERTCEYT